MKCPYCTSEINSGALVCPHCARDVHLVRQLQEKVATLEEEVRVLKQAQAPLGTCPAPALPEPAQAQPPAAAGVREWILLCGAPLVLLLVAHALITVVYDLNNLVLRLVSMIIPLPFGFLLMLRGRHTFGLALLAAFGMALLAVLGMSGVTALVDRVPVLPQSLREWREFIEYTASIGLSHVTGMVLGQMLRHHIQAEREQAVRGLAKKVAQLLNSGQQNVDKIESMAKKLNDLGGSLTAAATTAASVYMGLQGVIK